MEFTREPIIETVITPREGCKLVVRSSKTTGQEEYFVDAVEIVSFGHSFFFRSLERPKMFFVPATDYEILEVREARMVLKNVGLERTIKIAGGREPQSRQHHQPREQVQERAQQQNEVQAESKVSNEELAVNNDDKSDSNTDKKRERRRHSRRRRGRDGDNQEEDSNKAEQTDSLKENSSGVPSTQQGSQPNNGSSGTGHATLLPPPPMLISETMGRYKEMFKDAFYTKEEHHASPQEEGKVESTNGTEIEISQLDEGLIYLQRKDQILDENQGNENPENANPEIF